MAGWSGGGDIMPDAFNTEECVFFVGGRDDWTGDSDAAGIMLDQWLTNPVIGDYMLGNGVVKYENINGSYSNISGILILDLNTLPADDVVNGWIAHVTGAFITDGYYKITDSTGDPGPSTITIDAGLGADFDVHVWIGGALPTLQEAADIVDASAYTQYILDNKDETLAASIDFDVGGGSVANNSQKIIIGFNTTPPSNADADGNAIMDNGDMDKDGTYYQSAMDVLANTVTGSKSVHIDANNGAYDIFVLTGIDNLVFRNFYLHNTLAGGGTDDCVAFAGSLRGIRFSNCKFDDADRGMAGQSFSLLLDGCYFGDAFSANTHVNIAATSGFVTNCIFKGQAGFSYGPLMNYGIFDSCLFIGGYFGMYWYRTGAINNCIFYDQSVACMRINDAAYAVVRGHNNIFMPKVAADWVIDSTAARGTIDYGGLTHNCIWTIADVEMTNHISLNGVTSQLVYSVIEKNPLFVDAANKDFGLQPVSPCWNNGKPDIKDNPTTIGMITRQMPPHFGVIRGTV